MGRPILWYGVFFALGFFLAYGAFLALLRHENKTNGRKIADEVSTYVLIGIVVGARLFDVLFYENLAQFFHDPLFVIRVWEGGLSSHGAVVGLLGGVILYHRRHRHEFRLMHLFDLISIVAGITAACIRIGNFFNQEILGIPTTLPWGVIFGHPVDGSFPVARHPVQLYEAFYYLVLFGVMWRLKDHLKKWPAGRLTGLFLVLVFSFRFFIEFFKEEQTVWLAISFLKMGQWLSIPLIVLGVIFLLRKRR